MAHQGYVVAEYGPWKVVQQKRNHPDGKFVVVENHVKVYGPDTQAECEAWCRVSVGLLTILQRQIDKTIS
jgi:hypothetical protein